MFEVLQAYETAIHEKNILLRFIYTNRVKRSLKKTFFKKFKASIRNMKLEKSFIEEFNQFHECTKIINNKDFCVYQLSYNKNLYINYYRYELKFKFLERNCDVEIRDKRSNRAVVLHPEDATFYSSLFSKIILSAVYNYCVLYVYGEQSDLFIDDDKYVESIKSMYF